ncbi:MAG: DUF2809 domain-containing protein [Clostridiales bacterium]|nr:DUF2809 domain-containing protein [Clostridiales bacterium]
MKRKRLLFAAAAVILLAVEILIGLFVHDSFVRPYLGDTIVVILLWCIVRIVIPDKCVWLSAAVFVLAVLVEISQIFPLCDVLGIENRLLRVLMGTSFAWGDIVAYLAGCTPTLAVDLILWGRRRARDI